MVGGQRISSGSVLDLWVSRRLFEVLQRFSKPSAALLLSKHETYQQGCGLVFPTLLFDVQPRYRRFVVEKLVLGHMSDLLMILYYICGKSLFVLYPYYERASSTAFTA